ncbi:hypothetical protein GCM10010909_04290 [Acidocella aquatica]|uniref:Uncharacterized protein n=1 Tax=Acidocella aquatica TaxID=1922313 RepID=A0ABQ5ZZW6_9PROT|nr:hypothetical protein [Acidocella aquatica]GLR65751.1 hypothetical protein GCM10010909_04290 [Acidocella aquatica]
MKALFKTLFGSARTIAVAAGAVFLAVLALHGPVPGLAGAVFPAAMLAGAAYLARY